MSTVEQIEAAIHTLSLAERSELWRRLDVSLPEPGDGPAGEDADEDADEDGNDAWDRQIMADAKAGKFDRMIARAKAADAAGLTRPIP